jgi:hypothetical protein
MQMMQLNSHHGEIAHLGMAVSYSYLDNNKLQEEKDNMRLLIQFIRSYPPNRRAFLHPQPEDAPCRGDRDPLTHGSCTDLGKENK